MILLHLFPAARIAYLTRHREEVRGPQREATPEEIRERIRLRQEKAKSERSPDVLRSAIIAVLGHVDAGQSDLQRDFSKFSLDFSVSTRGSIFLNPN